MSQEFTPIQKLGRKGLIEALSKYEGSSSEGIRTIRGDDAAVIKKGGGHLILLSSDTFVEGADFDPSYTPFSHLGYKMISSSISDIYAMNGIPSAVLVNLAVPNRLSVEMITDLYKGMDEACKIHNVKIAGGDLTGNHNHTVISISVYGEVSEEEVTYRNGASEGDAICVTGDVGAAIAGLRILMREKKFWEEHGNQSVQPDLAEYKFVVQRQLMPEARLDVIKTLKAYSIKPTSMIDLTKGLISEVTELCEQSGVGAHLYEAALPIAVETRHVANEMEEDVDKYALFGGEDLELIFTLSEEQAEELNKHFKDFTVIGRMTPEKDGLIIQTAEGELIDFDDLS
ncbi:MAG: thiamine-phosphate kinase [Balneolales bacterium]|nr:thiamine-phosphate kinase [Balneolales bacterium]